MNPNLAQSLDPKLKETYDRVMGMQLNPRPATPKSPQPVAPVPQSQTPVQPASPVSAPEHSAQDDSQVEMVNINTPTPQGQTNTTAASAKKSKIKPVIFVAAGVLFFAIYTVIWLKFFSII